MGLETLSEKEEIALTKTPRNYIWNIDGEKFDISLFYITCYDDRRYEVIRDNAFVSEQHGADLSGWEAIEYNRMPLVWSELEHQHGITIDDVYDVMCIYPDKLGTSCSIQYRGDPSKYEPNTELGKVTLAENIRKQKEYERTKK